MSPVSTDDAATSARVAKRGAWMAVGRIADQAALGLAGLVLAARLSVEDYAPVALVLVAHSVAATLSDLGLAHELLRLGPGERADRRQLWVVRLVNLTALAVAMVLAVLGHWSAALAAVIWALNSEAMLRQSATMLADDHRRLGAGQSLAAAVLAVAVVTLAHDATALGLAIAARLLIELAVLRPCRPLFAPSAEARSELAPFRVLATHSIGFGNRNIDFLIGAPFLGTAGFARYVFAYRLANAGFAPVGTIATRLGIAELAGGGPQVADRYRRGTTALFIGGTGAALLTAAGALVVPLLVGQRWAEAVPPILFLSVALPFRFIDGIISPLLYVSDNHGKAVGLELARLALIAGAVLVGAQWGVTGLAVSMSGATVVSVLAGHRWAAARAGLAAPPWLGHAAAVALAILALAVMA